MLEMISYLIVYYLISVIISYVISNIVNYDFEKGDMYYSVLEKHKKYFRN